MTALLTASQVRELAAQLDLHPSKRLGQNFVVDANTIRRIVALSAVGPGDVVLEVGPGLGSLTLGLLDSGAAVVAVEIDSVLAGALPGTISRHGLLDRAAVIPGDALRLRARDVDPMPTALVANLPYNVSVPVLLHILEEFDTVATGLVMVQREVGLRLAAEPGSRTYGVPSAKLAWYVRAGIAGNVPRTVFWPMPNVDSVLVRLQRRDPPDADRAGVFAVIDAAFSQRRKMLRSALAGWAGSVERAERVLGAAGVDPHERGEALTLDQFVAVWAAARAAGVA